MLVFVAKRANPTVPPRYGRIGPLGKANCRAEHQHAARRLRLELDVAEPGRGEERFALSIVPDVAELRLQAEGSQPIQAERAEAIHPPSALHVVGELVERLAVRAGDADRVSGLGMRGER